MRALFVYFGPFDVNSAIQAYHFGNELTELGWEVIVAGKGDPARARAVGEPRFKCISHDELDREVEAMGRDPQETIVIGWTPREPVRRMTMAAVGRLGVPYTVHLEDNEELLIESATGRPLAELQRLPPSQQDSLAPPDLIHPTRHREFLDGAAGITVITEALNEFNRAGRPHALARPGIDLERFRPDLDPHPRERLGLGPEDFVLVYHGTIHYANQHEMMSLYLAVKLLQRRGHRVRLVRLGHSEFGGPDPRAFRALGDGVIELGPIPWREIPAYLALADAYVQPGPPDDFNRYRLPSKLPEFLAMGRPVILPHCNIGNDLRHGEDALLLEQGNAIEIVVRVEELLADAELRARLGVGARRFAAARLSWPANAAALAEFLRERSAEGRAVGSST
ncbi:MAG TPA: glycosyltransferase [Solirubrobacterales bacterium]|jgi:glycosyltransferase involved in cell wall biosynthesis